MHGSPERSDFWAKLKYKDDDRSTGEIVEWHPLVAHSADVAAVTEALLTRTILGDRLARLAGWEELTDVHVARLAALAAIHDAGKVNRGFQNRAFGKQPQADHVTPMVGMLTARKRSILAAALGLRKMTRWFTDGPDILSWLQTTWSHHGVPVRRERPNKGLWTDDALQRLADFKDWTRHWYPDVFDEAPPFTSSQVQHLFNGVLTLADWIASDRSLLPWRPDLTDPEEAIEEARQCRTPKALRNLRLLPNRKANTSLSNLLDGEEPYKVQEKTQGLPTSREGTLSILESATGSGKTEAALGRFARLLAEGLVDSLYFAVPTRAAAKQLHERIKTARDRIFGRKDPPVHLAVPGYLKVDDAEGMRFGWSVRWDEDIGSRGWASESSKRYTASPIAVGTIDQVLMSTLQRKHAHLRMAGLARSLLVVDEVHASSVYMNEALKQVLAFHHAMGGHALLMSATLGAEARAAFTGKDAPPFAEAKEQHYPLISHVSGSEIDDPVEPVAPEGRDKEVTLSLEGIMKEGDAAVVAARAEEAARAGAHVLVIRNTVKACQAVHRKLDSAWSLRVNEKATPHHSRYGADDRELLDVEVERVYGKHEEGDERRLVRKTDGHVVTVATQTVEQSLDIDADYLITDLCPMDVLLQRIGRLHRHQRGNDRPEDYRDAHCLILVPGAQAGIAASISEDTGKGFPGPGLGSVYPDLRIIEATRRALHRRVEAREPVVIPRDNRMLVEEATHSEVTDAFAASDARWAAHACYLRMKIREEVLDAQNVQIDHDQPFTSDDNRFPTERPKSRLGQEDVVVELPTKQETPFGNEVKELTLSPYFFSSDDERPPPSGTASSADPTPEGFMFSFDGEDFTYTARGIQKARA